MRKEEKELLLKDLSARLPYGVIVAYKSLESDRCNCDLFFKIGLGYGNIGYVAELGRGWWTDCKPYLRPMSSMTKEEKKELKEFHFYYTDDHIVNDEDNDLKPIIVDEIHCSCIIDWLNAHHFDYRGLIEKGLAIGVTEENNPYK